METKSVKIPLGNAAEGLAVFGPQDKYLRMVQQQVESSISSREAEIVITGPSAEVDSLEQLYQVLL
ncbi:phosphate starvation-inducible protein PhoH, partial [Paenibacillus sp. MCAF20]